MTFTLLDTGYWIFIYLFIEIGSQYVDQLGLALITCASFLRLQSVEIPSLHYHTQLYLCISYIFESFFCTLDAIMLLTGSLVLLGQIFLKIGLDFFLWVILFHHPCSGTQISRITRCPIVASRSRSCCWLHVCQGSHACLIGTHLYIHVPTLWLEH